MCITPLIILYRHNNSDSDRQFSPLSYHSREPVGKPLPGGPAMKLRSVAHSISSPGAVPWPRVYSTGHPGGFPSVPLLPDKPPSLTAAAGFLVPPLFSRHIPAHMSYFVCYVLQRLFPGMIAGKKPCFPSKSVLYFTGYDRENSGEPHGREGRLWLQAPCGRFRLVRP